MLFSIGKKNTALIWYGLLYFFLAPLTLFAQSTDLPKDATELLNRISTFIINPIIYLLFAAAFVMYGNVPSEPGLNVFALSAKVSV